MFFSAIMVTLLGLFVLWQFHIVVVYLLISLTLAATVRPFVQRLVRRGFVVRAAWIFLYLAALGIFGLLLFLVGRTAINEIQQLAHSVSAQDRWILPPWLEGSAFQQTLLARLPTPGKLFEAFTGDQGQLVLPALLGITKGFSGIVSAFLIIIFLSLYWIINQVHFERLWLSLLPSAQRKRARSIWRTIEPDLGAYIRCQIIYSLLAGLLLGLGYWAIGSPYPALLALAGALTCLIPVIGMPLAMVPPLLVGLLTSWQLSLFTVLFTLIILIALGLWVKPRIFNRKWDNPILTLIIIIILAKAFGLIGIIVAPPISAVCQILWSLLVSHRLSSEAAAEVSDLKERQERVRESIKAMKEPSLPLVTSSMEQLASLIEKAEPVLQAALPGTGLLAETFLLLKPIPPKNKPPDPIKHRKNGQ
jgi:predicted PurR-regulated permease PerM